MKHYRSLLPLAALLLAAPAPALALCPPDPGSDEPIDDGPDSVPGEYIVEVKAGVSPEAVINRYDVSPMFVYTTAFNGFAAALSASQLDGIEGDADVAAVQPNYVYHTTAVRNMNTNGDPWGLDRIDQRNLPLNGQYQYFPNGTGVHAYIIDTGLELLHSEFTGRASQGPNFIGGSNSDCNGHGTHVGATVGGVTYGVADDVYLVGVKVLDCNGFGTSGSVIAGINWVAGNAMKPAVANLSVGGPFDPAVNTATSNLVTSGVFTVVAAGNSCDNACSYSPASTPNAYTVTATTRTDSFATAFANFGPCVDTQAPGVDILSAKWGGGSTFKSGTSMAAPHVTGAVANFLEMNGDVPIRTIEKWLDRNATLGVVQNNPPNTVNQLLYSYKQDVMIRDTLVDSGLEPDPANTGAMMWLSPDIWVRHSPDGLPTHQNPEYGQTNYIYVHTRNRGWIAAGGSVEVYAAPASSGLAWPGTWTLVGSAGAVGYAPQTDINFSVAWNPPATGHYCFLARWVDYEDVISWDELTSVNYNTLKNNNIAWRNVNVVDLIAEPVVDIDMRVANVKPTQSTLMLSFEEEADPALDPLVDLAMVTVDLGDDLHARWVSGGSVGEGFVQVGKTQFLLVDPAGAWFGGIEAQGAEEFVIGIQFEADSTGHEDEEPRLFHAIQHQDDGADPVGGVSYHVALP